MVQPYRSTVVLVSDYIERRHIFLSPHPDDVVWSCGGRISALTTAGAEVLIVTCFDEGLPVEADLSDHITVNNSWRKPFACSSLRRKEDFVAISELGAKRLSLGFTEAALRQTQGYWLYESPTSLFGSPVKEDNRLEQELADALIRCLRTSDQINVPLALRSHVDHIIVRKAIERVVSDRLIFYEEFPYENPELVTGLVAEIIPVEIEAWISAALRYRSQISALFGNATLFRRRLKEWAEHRGKSTDYPYAERIWWHKSKDSK